MTDNILLFQLVDRTTVIARVITEHDGDYLLSYPVSLIMGNPMQLNTRVFGYKYSPFANNNEVFLSSSSIITYGSPDKRLTTYYQNLVEYYKSVQVSMVETDTSTRSEENDEIEIDEFDENFDEEILDEIEENLDEYFPSNNNKNTYH